MGHEPTRTHLFISECGRRTFLIASLGVLALSRLFRSVPIALRRTRRCACYSTTFPAHHFVITRLGPKNALLPPLTSRKRNSELTDVRSRYARCG
jgi:hypothetical protein